MTPRTAFANAIIARNVVDRFVGRVGMEFPSEDALEEYLHEHPKADPKKHEVKEAPEKSDDGDKDTLVAKPGKKEQELGAQMSMVHGAKGSPALRGFCNKLIGKHKVTKSEAQEVVKELEKLKSKAEEDGKTKTVKDTSQFIDKVKKLLEGKELPEMSKAEREEYEERLNPATKW